MGDPAYEARRERERIERDAVRKEKEDRERIDQLFTEVAELALSSLRSFIRGDSVLVVERVDDTYTLIRFRRAE